MSLEGDNTQQRQIQLRPTAEMIRPMMKTEKKVLVDSEYLYELATYFEKGTNYHLEAFMDAPDRIRGLEKNLEASEKNVVYLKESYIKSLKSNAALMTKYETLKDMKLRTKCPSQTVYAFLGSKETFEKGIAKDDTFIIRADEKGNLLDITDR